MKPGVVVQRALPFTALVPSLSAAACMIAGAIPPRITCSLFASVISVHCGAHLDNMNAKR